MKRLNSVGKRIWVSVLTITLIVAMLPMFSFYSKADSWNISQEEWNEHLSDGLYWGSCWFEDEEPEPSLLENRVENSAKVSNGRSLWIKSNGELRPVRANEINKLTLSKVGSDILPSGARLYFETTITEEGAYDKTLDGLVDTYLPEIGEYTVTYNDEENGVSYQAFVDCILPEVGLYSAPVASQDTFIGKYYANVNANETYYIICNPEEIINKTWYKEGNEIKSREDYSYSHEIVSVELIGENESLWEGSYEIKTIEEGYIYEITILQKKSNEFNLMLEMREKHKRLDIYTNEWVEQGFSAYTSPLSLWLNDGQYVIPEGLVIGYPSWNGSIPYFDESYPRFDIYDSFLGIKLREQSCATLALHSDGQIIPITANNIDKISVLDNNDNPTTDVVFGPYEYLDSYGNKKYCNDVWGFWFNKAGTYKLIYSADGVEDSVMIYADIQGVAIYDSLVISNESILGESVTYDDKREFYINVNNPTHYITNSVGIAYSKDGFAEEYVSIEEIENGKYKIVIDDSYNSSFVVKVDYDEIYSGKSHFRTTYLYFDPQNPDDIPADGSKLTIFCWNDEYATRVINLLPDYRKTGENTGYIGNTEVVWKMFSSDNGNYRRNLNEYLNTNALDVDLFLVEADYASEYCKPGVAKSLDSIGITKTELAGQYDYTKEVVSTGGKQYGSSWQTCGSCMIYNRDIAKAVLGTDDPNQIQSMVSDWDKWMAVSARMEQAGYKMTPCAETTYRTYSSNVTTPWVQNGTINIDDNILRWINDSKDLVDNNRTGTFDFWNTYEDFLTNTSFCVFGPEWYWAYCMMAGSGDSIADRGGWAVCEGPQASWWGGTWVCVADKTDNLDLATYILRATTLDESFLTDVVEEYGDNVNNKNVINRLAQDNSYADDVLGGQNPYTVLKDVLVHARGNQYQKYSQTCNDCIQNAMKYYFLGNISYEQALDNFYTSVIDIYPELKAGVIEEMPEVTLDKVDEGVKLTWNAIDGTAKYRVFRKAEGEAKFTALAKVSGTTYIDKNVEAGKTYYYTVRCMDTSGKYFGPYNAEGWSIDIPKLIQADFSVEKTSAGVSVKWKAVEGVAKYRVMRKAEGETKFTALAKVSGTSYSDKNVEPGKTYTYTVRCMDGTGAYIGTYDTVGKSIEIPAVIQADFSVESDPDGVKISWNAVDGAAKYRVMRKAEGETKFTAISKISATSYIDKNVEAGKTYTYTVRCMDGTGAYIGTYDTVGKDITIEASIQADFTVESNSEGVKISWNAVNGAAKYRVMRKADGESKFTALAKVSGTSYTDKTVEAGKTYTYTVRCMDGTGAYIGTYDTVGKDITIEASTQAEFSVESNSEGVKISWNAVNGAAKYRVMRKAEGESKFTALAKVSGTSYTDKTVEAGKTYTYTVRCMDETGAYIGTYDTVGKTISIEAAVQADFNIEISNGNVSVTWNAVNGAAKYRVMRKAEGESSFTALAKVSGMSYTDKNVEAGKTYTYTVRCMDSEGKYIGTYDLTGKSIDVPYAVATEDIAETESVEESISETIDLYDPTEIEAGIEAEIVDGTETGTVDSAMDDEIVK